MSAVDLPSLRRETATIAFVDVVESVRLIADAEDAAVLRIRKLLKLAAHEVSDRHGGQVAERRGDGLVLKFSDTRQAVRCMSRLHRLAAEERNTDPLEAPLRLRAGLHRSQLLADDEALYGEGVNLAARIAALGQPGDTLMSAAARDELLPGIDGFLQDMGPCWLKHVDEPVRLFRHHDENLPLPRGLEDAISRRMKLRPTLAVLAFEDLHGASSLRFGPGEIVADQLTRRLSQSSMLHVISALSTRALGGRHIELGQLYTLLRADYVLRGRMRGVSGDDPSQRVVVYVELWRRGSNEPVWIDEFHASLADLLSTEGEVVGRITHLASRRIVSAEQTLARSIHALPNLASHTMYLVAVDLLHRFSIEDFSRARDLLVELSERAPRHAEPMAWLARWHVFKVVQGWSDDRAQDGDKALYYSERALERDSGSALALTMAGSVHAGVKRDAETAQHYYDQALAHNPNDSLAWLMSGVAKGFMNSGPPALAASEMALGLAPVEPIRHYYDALAATAALRAGEYERCITLARRSVAANSRHGTAYRSMAIALGALGRHAEAAEAVSRLLGVEPHFTVKTYLARVPSQDAHRETFAEILEQAGLPSGR
jgi:adenylate cyclase